MNIDGILMDSKEWIIILYIHNLVCLFLYIYGIRESHYHLFFLQLYLNNTKPPLILIVLTSLGTLDLLHAFLHFKRETCCYERLYNEFFLCFNWIWLGFSFSKISYDCLDLSNILLSCYTTLSQNSSITSRLKYVVVWTYTFACRCDLWIFFF